MISRRVLVAVSLLLCGPLAACAGPAPGSAPSPPVPTPAAAGAGPGVSGVSGASGASGAFYDLGRPVGEGPPGEILRIRELAALQGGRLWVVLYRSTGLDGSPIAVSGLIGVPDGPPPPGGRPVIGFGHGTTGAADICAPSYDDIGGDLAAEALPLVQMGFVVAATDYEGLGTPGVHPYVVGLSAGRTVLDAVRAARSLPEAATGQDVALLGHSQGGHAVLWAAQLADGYAAELNVRAVVAGSPAGDLSEVVRPRGEVSGAGRRNIELAVHAWREVYGLPLDRVLDASDQARLGETEMACRDDLSGVSVLVDLASDPDWGPRLVENSPGAQRSTAPILYVQGTADEQIPVESARSAVVRLCGAGDTVEYREFDGENHRDPLFGSGREEAAVAWIRDRFAGTPPVSNCP